MMSSALSDAQYEMLIILHSQGYSRVSYEPDMNAVDIFWGYESSKLSNLRVILS